MGVAGLLLRWLSSPNGIEALIPRLAASGVQLPQYFLLMLPYAVTLGVMIWSSLSDRRDMSPKSLGTPFSREERT